MNDDLIPQENLNAPAIIGAAGIEGLEDLDAEDIRIPRVKLLQGSSEEVKMPDEYPNLRTGMIINSITKEPLTHVDKDGRKVYPFIPVKMFKSWMKFNPMKSDMPGFDPNHEPGSMLFKTYDANDPITRHKDAWQWKQINFLGFQPDNPRQPIFISFASMSRPVGSDMINLMQMAGRPVYEHVFHLGSRTAEKNGNTFMVYTAKSEGKPSDELCAIGKQMYNEFNPILADMKNSNVELDDADRPWEYSQE